MGEHSVELREIKEWISINPHLPQEYEDEWLQTFFRGCKYSVDRCKHMLNEYFASRRKYPEYFTNRDPTSDEIRDLNNYQNDTAFWCHLLTEHDNSEIVCKFINRGKRPLCPVAGDDKRYRCLVQRCTKEGYSVVYAGCFCSRASEFLSTADIKKICMLIDAAIKDGNLDIVLVVDGTNISLSHAMKMIPLAATMIHLFFNAVPIHIKQIHIVNINRFGKMILAAVKVFLKEKLKNRIHIHTDIRSLQNFIPKRSLPKEYGGKAGPLKDINDKSQKDLEEFKDWFILEEKKLH